MEQIQSTDRYEALGITPPSLLTVCRGQCEGTGAVPVFIHASETDPRLVALWNEAEAASPSGDGWHFVTCPDCQGTGKRTGRFPRLANLPNLLRCKWKFFRHCILNMDCRAEPSARWSRLKHLKVALPILFKNR
ncbi:hypothetical protein Srufu_079730 (plasmid) [Streptomyces libani subsp. rufus]|nr:hypothetical protein Srufu_079730 [Streptomyces libani subsp. rufus]